MVTKPTLWRPVTYLSDSDVSQHRSVSWRSLLGMIGIGASVGAVAVVLPATPGKARCKGGVCVGSADISGAPSTINKRRSRHGRRAGTRPTRAIRDG
jgi:hypothetical protein